MTTLAEVCAALPIFQSTQPSQAVTTGYEGIAQVIDISIHTAFAGCDVADNMADAAGSAFQSTQPSQAVTVGKARHKEAGQDFNPHSLRRL